MSFPFCYGLYNKVDLTFQSCVVVSPRDGPLLIRETAPLTNPRNLRNSQIIKKSGCHDWCENNNNNNCALKQFVFIQGAGYFHGVSHIKTNGYACFSLSMCVTLLTWKLVCIGTFVSECVFLSFRMLESVYLCVVCSFHLTILPPMERLLSPEVPAADKLFRHSEIFKFLIYSFYLFFVISFFIGFLRYYFFIMTIQDWIPQAVRFFSYLFSLDCIAFQYFVTFLAAAFL